MNRSRAIDLLQTMIDRESRLVVAGPTKPPKTEEKVKALQMAIRALQRCIELEDDGR